MEFRIDDPQLTFSCESGAFGLTKDYVEVRIIGWCGAKQFTRVQIVPSDYIGAPHWPHVIRGMKLNLVETMLGQQGTEKFTIAQRR